MTETTPRIPTTIFSGFLGSGKTTLIIPLIDYVQQQGQQVIYVKNEIGDMAVDSQIMQGKNIKTKELLNGCICCTLVGPFLAAINEVIDTFHPDRIIIEASGAADPSAIAIMVSSNPRLQRDGVISVVDVVNFEGYKDLSEAAQRQTEFTDIIVFNKVEQVNVGHKRAVVGYVRELNSHSPIVEAPNGKLDPNLVFGINSKELELLLQDSTVLEEHSHLEHDHLDSFHSTFQQPFQKDKLLEYMSQLPSNVFRVKGYVQLTSEDMKLINKVGNRTELSDPPLNIGFRPSSLVFIGFNIIEQKNQIIDRLNLCF